LQEKVKKKIQLFLVRGLCNYLHTFKVNVRVSALESTRLHEAVKLRDYGVMTKRHYTQCWRHE